MLVKGKLVVKLPSERVDSLVAESEGEPFDSGTGKHMREWFTLSSTSTQRWHALAKEAMKFVEGRD